MTYETSDAESLRDRAIALYKAPFKFSMGYIWDANNKMVADEIKDGVILRIRGWGRIQDMPDAANLQDEVGKLIAELLTEHWNKEAK